MIKMNVFLLILSIFGPISALFLNDVLKEEWQAYKLEHRKQYVDRSEEQRRLKIYLKNRLSIAKHNQQHALGNVTYMMGLNMFSDMDVEELQKLMNNENEELSFDEQQEASTYIWTPEQNVTKTIDWRMLGAVTAVKSQGHCGSCWSFATTGSLEGQHFRKTGELISLSEQNLIDCSTSHGCQGGNKEKAFLFIRDNGGINTEHSYPYEGIQNSCRFEHNNIIVTVSGYTRLVNRDEQELMQAVATIGPIAVSIDASLASFHMYKSGVYYDSKCSSVQLNHGVLVVGYGNDPLDGDYWLVKNSWSGAWGEDGYIRMARNRENHCGIVTRPSYPLV